MTNAKEIISLIEDIEGVKITYIDIKNKNLQNRLSIRIADENDIGKWGYFNYKLKKADSNIVLQERGCDFTYLFPSDGDSLEKSLVSFISCLSCKYYLIRKPQNSHLNIIAKVTNRCPIDCQYCYDRPFRIKLGHNGTITIEKIDRLLDLASKYAENVTFLFHGGEPTLVGIPFVKQVLYELLPKYPYCNFEVDMQSNGMLLNEKWFEMFEEYNRKNPGKTFGIGTSYSATAEDLRHTSIDNEYKVEGDISKVINAMKLSKNYVKVFKETPIGYKKEYYSLGAIDVLTRENHKNIIQIYEFYKRNKFFSCFNIVHRAGAACNKDFLFEGKEAQEEYENTVRHYFKYWATDTDENCYVDRYASMYMAMLLGCNDSICEFSPDCTGQWLAINSNGDIYPCDRALPLKYRMGNVLEFNSIEEAYHSQAYMTFRTEREQKHESYCDKCNYQPYCFSGCPMKDIDVNGTAAKPNTGACELFQIGLKAAWDTLKSLTFEECNQSLKYYLLVNSMLLPQEIPAFINEYPTMLENLPGFAGIKVTDLDFKNAELFSKEFELFAAINPAPNKKRILPLIQPAITTVSKCIKLPEDNRIEKLKMGIATSAKEAEENLKKSNNI